MSDFVIDETDIYSVSAAATRQAACVRDLKKSGAPAADIESAVAILKDLRAKAEKLQANEIDNAKSFNRRSFDELLLAKMFVVPSFEIHGGVCKLVLTSNEHESVIAIIHNLLVWSSFLSSDIQRSVKM